MAVTAPNIDIQPEGAILMTLTRTTGRDLDTGELIITDPRDGSLVGRLAMTKLSDLSDIVASVAAAATSWAGTVPAERGLALRRAAAALLENEVELATLNERETGKPYEQSLGGVRAGADTLLQYAELGPLHAGRRLRGPALATDYMVPEPRGVVAVITPWNDPVAVAAGLIGAALVTGNTVLHKPSERCPHLGIRLGELLEPIFPPDVLHTVTGDATVGAALIARPTVAMVAHVGSTAAGERIARTAALVGSHLIRENGGNDALIIDADVDPGWAAEQAAIGAFANSGQICTSVERIFVHRDIAGQFLEQLCAQARRRNDNGELGPLVDDALRESVHRQVTESVELGAAAAVGGFLPEGPGSYYPATVITNCDLSMPLMTEETFGPVAPIQVVASFAEGLQRAAADRYGLAATVLTASLEHAQQAAAALPVGTVKINNVFGGAPGGSAQPRGASGSGFGYGPELLDEMTTTKVVHVEPPGRPSGN